MFEKLKALWTGWKVLKQHSMFKILIVSIISYKKTGTATTTTIIIITIIITTAIII